MNVWKAIVFSVLLWALGSHCAVAQSRVLFQIGTGNDGEDQLKTLMEDFRSAAEFRINGRISELARVCELTKSQEAKLRIAAKGALKNFVKNEITEKREELRGAQIRAGINVDDGGDDEGGEGDAEGDGQANLNQVLRMQSFFMETKPGQLVEQEALWQKSFVKILTEEQEEKLKTWRAERQKELTVVAIQRFVAQAKLTLFLTDDQIEPMRKVAEENLAEPLFEALKHTLSPSNDFVIMTNGLQQDSPQYDEIVAEFLTEEQVEEWNRIFEPQLKKMSELPDW
jgi:hypothetical protein